MRPLGSYRRAELADLVRLRLPERAAPALILRTEDGRVLPILISEAERVMAAAILTGSDAPPFHLSLLVEILNKAGLTVRSALIPELEGTTYRALLCLEGVEPAGIAEVPAAAADAVIVAWYTEAPILVSEDVLQIASAKAGPGHRSAPGPAFPPPRHRALVRPRRPGWPASPGSAAGPPCSR